MREGTGAAANELPVPPTHQTRCANTRPLHQETLLYRSSGGGQVLLADLVQHCEHFPGD